MFLPEHLAFLLANAGVFVPMIYDAVINSTSETPKSVLGFLEAIFGAFISLIQAFRDKMNSKNAEVVNENKEKKDV